MQFNVDAKYNEYLKLFNIYLDEFLLKLDDSSPLLIREALSYAVSNGGKRVRPVLCLATAEMLGMDFSRVKNYCIALELIHSYSLVHDDLPAMDNDDFRRGKLSTHKKFGEAYGILAGDALLNLAIETCFDNDCFSEGDFKACKLLFDYSGYKGMIGGQVLDLLNEKNDNPNQKDLFDVYINKTGKLLTAPLLISSLLSNGKYFTNLKEYGENLGLTFQIIDDIIDVEGSLESIGKTPNKDSQEDKLTSVKVFGLQGAKQKAKEYYQKTIKSVENIDNNKFLLEFAKKLYERKF